MTQLEQAIAIAVNAHAGQIQKNGDPYILHPLHLMMQMDTEAERITAVLHDVVEDTEWSLADLQAEGFPDEVLVAIALLTRQTGMTYEEFIEEIVPHPLARKVKIADVTHNLDTRRLPSIALKDLDRLIQYHAALARLQSPD
ncbi:MAG: GTP pyrophosphokinase [Candidatus Promineifilaceae bacterium]